MIVVITNRVMVQNKSMASSSLHILDLVAFTFPAWYIWPDVAHFLLDSAHTGSLCHFLRQVRDLFLTCHC